MKIMKFVFKENICFTFIDSVVMIKFNLCSITKMKCLIIVYLYLIFYRHATR